MVEQSPKREAIAAVIKRDDGRYLMVRRAQGISAGGYWSTVTGKPEPGESLASTLRREVHEEVGLWVSAAGELYRCPTHNHLWTIIWFEAVLDEPERAYGPLRTLASEIEEAVWMTPREAARCDPMFPDTRRFFVELAGGDRV